MNYEYYTIHTNLDISSSRGNFPTASSWCEKTNMMMADKERLAEVVPGGCSSEKRLTPAMNGRQWGLQQNKQEFSQVLKQKLLQFRIKRDAV
jgi:hypothetical protein